MIPFVQFLTVPFISSFALPKVLALVSITVLSPFVLMVIVVVAI